MNKPVAWIGETLMGRQYINGQKDELPVGTPLYTHPVKELNDVGEPVKNATYWKRQYNLMATQNDNLKSGLYHANEQIKYLEGQLDIRTRELIGASFYEHDYKTLMAKPSLTDEEIEEIGKQYLSAHAQFIGAGECHYEGEIEFARAILRKAQ